MFGRARGFTIVELIAVLVIAGVLGVTIINKVLPSTTFQLQASRDQVVAAFFSAQQRAMSQTAQVRLTTSGTTIDIRQDTNGDNNFSPAESIKVGGAQYPIDLQQNQSLSAGSFTFDRLGQTSSAILVLSQGGGSVSITVSESGYAY